MPRSCSRRSASRTGVRLTPSARAISSSGIRSPGANLPSQIASRNAANTNSLREVLRSASGVAAVHLRAFGDTVLLASGNAIGVRSCRALQQYTDVYNAESADWPVSFDDRRTESSMAGTGSETKPRMQYCGLRGWLEQVDKLCELRQVDGASWDAEMG